MSEYFIQITNYRHICSFEIIYIYKLKIKAFSSIKLFITIIKVIITRIIAIDKTYYPNLMFIIIKMCYTFEKQNYLHFFN